MPSSSPFEKALHIGQLTINPPLALAPMSGITNSCFRKLIALLDGCGLFFSEMISAQGLIRRNNKKTRTLLKRSSLDRPLFFQIFGSEAKIMGEAALVLKRLGADGIDINMSCPKQKVVRKNAGAALLKDIKLAQEIITEVVKKSEGLPVSVKIRAGWSGTTINALQFAHMIEHCGASAIIIHPRTRTDFFSSLANWELIRKIKENVSIPVIGNGDVKKPSDILAMFNQTGCDGVMIGRGAIVDPLIFKKFLLSQCGVNYNHNNFKEKTYILRKYLRLLENEDFSEKEKLNNFKKFIIWFTKGMKKGKELRKKVILSETSLQAKKWTEDFFK
ncbi:MAG: tRNA dihydrouridine synthase [Candidatus Aminicenantia bacterium]